MPPPSVGSSAWHGELRNAAARLRAAEVGTVRLVHGTFVGDDALGFLDTLGRYFPAARDWFTEFNRSFVDRVVGDNGNYVEPFATALEEALNTGGPRIVVRRFRWSGQNHHLGRAVAAVALLDDLLRIDPHDERRLLCWGHSHAGNVFALLTNLLGGDDDALTGFFDAAGPYVKSLAEAEAAVWRRVEHDLRTGTARRLASRLDLVTFGTPIRYGWDLDGCAGLLHFVHHKQSSLAALGRTLLPRTPRDLQSAAAGDYVQHFGIAGTNFPPSILQWNSWRADRALDKLLQAGYSPLDLIARLRLGLRVPDAGRTLLVDYGPIEGNVAQHLAGHAVYTKPEWLPFHAAETARWLYEPPVG